MGTSVTKRCLGNIEPAPALHRGPAGRSAALLHRLVFAAALVAATACSAQQQDAAPAPAGALPFVVTPVADLDAPWAMAFLPDGRMLVTEKKGQMLLLSADGKQRRAIATIPVDSAGQGALMDVVLAPGLAQNKQVYYKIGRAHV